MKGFPITSDGSAAARLAPELPTSVLPASVLPASAMRTLATPAPAAAHRPVAVPAAVDVAVVGAGVIGLSVAWRLAQRRLSVAVFDRAGVGAGASLAATGMLAAAAEHEPGDPELLALALESQRMWPAFGRALEAQSGLAIDFRESGTLVVALGRDEVERLRFRHDLHRRCGLATRWLGGPEVRAMEPGLRPAVAAGLFCPDDHQVDPRLVMAALRGAFLASGGHLIEHCAVEALDLAGGRVCGIATAAGRCRAATVVLAAGAWTAGNLLPPGLVVPVRPLKGQALALTATAQTGTLSHIVWTEQVHMESISSPPRSRRRTRKSLRPHRPRLRNTSTNRCPREASPLDRHSRPHRSRRIGSPWNWPGLVCRNRKPCIVCRT